MGSANCCRKLHKALIWPLSYQEFARFIWWLWSDCEHRLNCEFRNRIDPYIIPATPITFWLYSIYLKSNIHGVVVKMVFWRKVVSKNDGKPRLREIKKSLFFWILQQRCWLFSIYILKLFTDLISALNKVTSELKSINSLPKVEGELMSRTLSEPPSLDRRFA